MKYENYDEIRFWLFTESYIGKQISHKLRQKYNITTVDKWKLHILHNHWNLFINTPFTKDFDFEKEKNPIERGLAFHFAIREVEKKITPKINEVANILELNVDLFRIFIIYKNLPNKLSGPDKFVFASPERPITDLGYYIKVDFKTKKKDIEEAFHTIKTIRLPVVFGKNKNKTILKSKKRSDIGIK